MNSKIVLLTYDRLHIGGIETLITRMSNWLINNNYHVIIIVKKRGQLCSLLDSRINIIELRKSYSYIYFYIPNSLKKIDFSNVVAAMSFSPKSNWVLSNILTYFNCNCVNLMGVYHPRAYTRSGLHLSEKIIGQELLKSNKKNILFVNEECRYFHSNVLYASFVNSKIWPIPVNAKNTKNTKNNSRYLIVSVGRLTSFKTYNLYMIDIIKKLHNSGCYVYYDIYGTGELKDKMLNKIKALHMTKYITLKGNLEYSHFTKVVSSANLFVGMGTAAIEAGFCNIPVIVSIENNPNGKTYGYLYNLPYYNIGESNASMEEKDVYILVKKTIKLTKNEYKLICNKTLNYVQEYSMEKLMTNWIKFVNHGEKILVKVTLYMKLKYILLELINPLLKIVKK